MEYQNLDILHTEEPFLILQLFRKYPDPNAASLLSPGIASARGYICILDIMIHASLSLNP